MYNPADGDADLEYVEQILPLVERQLDGQDSGREHAQGEQQRAAVGGLGQPFLLAR